MALSMPGARAMFCRCFLFNSSLGQETSYLRMYQTDVHQIFRFDRFVDRNDRPDIRFLITQGTLLW